MLYPRVPGQEEGRGARAGVGRLLLSPTQVTRTGFPAEPLGAPRARPPKPSRALVFLVSEIATHTPMGAPRTVGAATAEAGLASSFLNSDARLGVTAGRSLGPFPAGAGIKNEMLGE